MKSDLKIVTWNCGGAFRKKLDAIDDHDADILVIQECEDPQQSTQTFRRWAGEYLWIGTNKNKGIGIFPKKGHVVRELSWCGSYRLQGLHSDSSTIHWETTELKLFLPFKVDESLDVVAVWTKSENCRVFRYIGQLWKFLQIHRNDLASGNQILLGDFNSNTIWDRPDRWWNHSDVVNELTKIGLRSLYHVQNNEAHGCESIPTFYLHKKLNKAYHIDYAFLSKHYHGSEIQIGESSDWLSYSDHMPLFLKIRQTDSEPQHEPDACQ